MKIPKQIEDQYNKLLEIIAKDDKFVVSTDDAAELFDLNVETYRKMAEHGTLPFAVCCKENKYANRIVRTNKLALYNWIMRGNTIEE